MAIATCIKSTIDYKICVGQQHRQCLPDYSGLWKLFRTLVSRHDILGYIRDIRIMIKEECFDTICVQMMQGWYERFWTQLLGRQSGADEIMSWAEPIFRVMLFSHILKGTIKSFISPVLSCLQLKLYLLQFFQQVHNFVFRNGYYGSE